MENAPLPPQPPPPLPAAPILPYQNHDLVPRRSGEALIGFALSICLTPASIFAALYFQPGVGFGVLCVGSFFTLALGLAGLKEIRESNGLVYGLPLAIMAICFSLAPILLVIAGIVFVALLNMLMRS